MSQVVQSLAEVYRAAERAEFVRGVREAGASRVVILRFAQPAGAFPDPPTNDLTLALNESGRGRMVSDVGAGRHEQLFRVGDLMLKPPMASTFFSVDAPHAKRFLSIPADQLKRLTEQVSGRERLDFGRLHAQPIRPHGIRPMIDAFWQEMRRPGEYCALLVEGVLLALTASLLQLANATIEPPRPATLLSPARLRLLDEWLEHHMAENFGIDAMAAAVGLSAFHFSRALKASTGQTPRALVTQRRLERARTILDTGTTPLADIAAALGFVDQAHFTNSFRKAHGIAPGAWRRMRCGR